MIREEILYQASKTGTTAFYFAANTTSDLVPFLTEPAYVVLNSYNQPTSFFNYSSGATEIWSLQNVNNYNLNILLSSVTTNYITGYSMSQTFNKTLSANEIATTQQRFNDNVISIITGQTTLPANFITYVFFNEELIDDLYANIKLSRTVETLDTLKIYNNPINSITTQEATTGVIFGKLQAIQTLKDGFGNNIKIPLPNVPIGIFNTSSEFPSPTSLDNNGDRFYLNLQESSATGQYFDSIAYSEDHKYLRTADIYSSVPDKFKYITITNDNGEFVIYNAPVGSQVIAFEVDLFKQGLTKDEIALNNFPFPTDDDANIGQFPSYYYNQIPIDVLPAWGTIQTGYTEVNINVNLDLKKWATYIFAPAAYGQERLETAVANNTLNNFKIQIRDMTNPGFSSKIVQLAEVPNDLDRRPDAKYFWFNELPNQRDMVNFYKFGCHIIKLPANLYDPNAYRTDINGIPMSGSSNKGVWLASYQFRTFVNVEFCYRDTGGFYNGTNFWSNYGVNNFDGATSSIADLQDFSGVGKFPYEKPWSLTYPNKYQIPQKPTQQRFSHGTDRTYKSPYYILEEPAYSDGDLVGAVIGAGLSDVGGFGMYNSNGIYFPNEIGFVATNSFMYKYESGVAWNEIYANGYQPYWNSSNIGPYTNHSLLAGMSSVNNGEKFQRVECGYGYFMKYQNWPRVFRADWSADIYYDTQLVPGYIAPGSSGNFNALFGFNHNAWDINNQNFAFAFDQMNASTNGINKGGIDIYRIVDSGIGNIDIPQNFIIPTFINLNCDQTSRCGNPSDGRPAWILTHTGEFPVHVNLNFNTGPTSSPYGNVIFQKADGTPSNYVNGTDKKMNPGDQLFSFDRHTFSYVGLQLPGNANFDSNQNRNTIASYLLEVNLFTQPNSSSSNGQWQGTFNAQLNSTTATAEWDIYWVSVIATGAHKIIQNGLSDDFDFGGATYPWNYDNSNRPDTLNLSTAHHNQNNGEYI